jgi:hypothetical protein
MNHTRLIVVASTAAIAIAAGWGVRSARADEVVEVDPIDAYHALVATHGAGPPVVDAELPPECPAGFVLWHRDVETDLCAPLCASDADCIEGLERCAAIPTPSAYTAAAEGDVVDRVFVDDEPAVLEGTVEAAGDEATVIAICDPLFDVEGAASAELIEIAPSDEGD